MLILRLEDGYTKSGIDSEVIYDFPLCFNYFRRRPTLVKKPAE